MKRIFTLTLLASLLFSFVFAQNWKQMTPREFADDAQTRIRNATTLNCYVRAARNYDNNKWDFVVNAEESNFDELKMWVLLGGVVGAFYNTKYTKWSSDRVWIASWGTKVAYISTSACRAIYPLFEQGRNFEAKLEIEKCLRRIR